LNTTLIALFSIGLSVSGQFFLKAGTSAVAVKQALTLPLTAHNTVAVLTNVHILCGLLLYGLGAIVWLVVLSRWDISKAYPFVGLGFAITAIVGSMAGEHVSLPRFAGVALICAGVWIVART
jgi:multidrug transporter EmrE-like cation transporter